MEGEHPDQFVEDHDRNGEDRAGAETQQRGGTSERKVVELRRRLDILDRQGLAASDREVRDREVSAGGDGLQSRLLPLRRGDVAVRAKTDQAAVRRERLAGFFDRDPQQLVDVQLRPNASRDSRNEALSVEGLRQTRSRARPIERKRALARDPLQLS